MSSSSFAAPMRAEAPSSPPLSYLQPSPVRGQLEPYNPRANKGFPGRFLQCTDTPNQLRVLLPPSTAQYYEQLLKYETAELAKKPPISWERILEIRHLKDRMIRKCQKLCKTTAPRRLGRGESFAFQTFIAPADFRLKEMERWLKHQPDRVPASAQPARLSLTSRGRPNSTCCSRCAQGQPHRATSSASSGSSADSDHAPLDKSRSPSLSPQAPPPIPIPEPTIPMPIPEPFRHDTGFEPPYSSSPPAEASMHLPPRAEAISPEPLPVPYRGSMDFSNADAAGIVVSSDPFVDPTPPATNDGPGQEKYVPPPLRRRRSCIKQNSSDSIKSVSWADAKDWTNQVSKYAAAVDEAQVSGKVAVSLVS
ncbi:hypothetical protein HGRIS_007964 [Hohenbuehelia grisea]|uniref:Uncharacterized protein n=1 Tax=Hohenbuehelia grisea TaxID=104357 RepID=A0ABR3J6W8_9AGAR